MKVTLLCVEEHIGGMSETASESAAYAERTPLVDLLGDSARVKMASVFATQRNREFSISELARQAGVSRKTAYGHIDELEALGVVDSREVTQGQRYRYADDSPVAEKLYELSGVTLQRRHEMRDDVETP